MTWSRLWLPVLALVASSLMWALPAYAGDGPAFGASDLIIEEDGLAEGWEIIYDEVPGTPGETLEPWVVQVAEASGLEEDNLYSETRIVKGKAGQVGTVLVVEVEGDMKTFAKDLRTRGESMGYAVRPLGHPSRLLLVAAPEASRKAFLDLQIEYAVRSLTKLAFERLNKGGHVGAVGFAKGAREIEGTAGAPMVVLGMVATRDGQHDEAIEAFRIGFDKKATFPAQGRLAMRGYAHYGKACLMKKDPSLFREARDAMEKAVALESQGDPKEDPFYIQRYNLACAHSRLKEVDQALAQLEKALQMLKVKSDLRGLGNFIENHVRTDEDLAPIRDDPGFEAVIERVLGGAEIDEGL